MAIGGRHPDELPGPELVVPGLAGNRPEEVDAADGAKLGQCLGFLLERGVERRPHGMLDEHRHAKCGRQHDQRHDAREGEHELPAEAAGEPHRARSSRMKPAPRMLWSSRVPPGTSSLRRSRLTCTSTRFESPS